MYISASVVHAASVFSWLMHTEESVYDGSCSSVRDYEEKKTMFSLRVAQNGSVGASTVTFKSDHPCGSSENLYCTAFCILQISVESGKDQKRKKKQNYMFKIQCCCNLPKLNSFFGKNLKIQHTKCECWSSSFLTLLFFLFFLIITLKKHSILWISCSAKKIWNNC